MKQRASVAVVLALLASLWATASLAEEQYSERTLDIARDLQCPVCQGQSVADSGAPLAKQMRGIIEEKVRAGESDEAIFAYFVDRYGESILSDPPKSGFSLALWWAPVLAIAVGALVVFLYLRESVPGGTARRNVAEADRDAELEAIARDALGDRERRVTEP